MKRASTIVILALLLQTLYVPCGAQRDSFFKASDIGRFEVGMLVEVTYRPRTGKKETSEGYIKRIEDDAIVVGKGFWKERILYRDTLSLIALQKEAVRNKITSGARVRITAPSVVDHTFSGVLVAMGTDSLKVKPESKPQLDIPLTSVTRFELSLGQTSKARKGALLGFLSGAISGAVLGASMGKEDYYDPYAAFLFTRGAYVDNPSSKEMAITMGALLGITGIAVGAFIGSRIQDGEERWSVVPLFVRTGSLPQSPSGFAVTASLSF